MSKNTTNKEADFLFSLVKDRYGDRLKQEELEEVRKEIEGIVKAAEVLRLIKMRNNDEPFTKFIPYRKDG